MYRYILFRVYCLALVVAPRPPAMSSSTVGREENAAVVRVRKSSRDPTASYLTKKDVASLLEKIRNNHKDTIILKLKDHMLSDINPTILSSIFEALKENTVCVRKFCAYYSHIYRRFHNCHPVSLQQALYAQNLTVAFGDQQLQELIDLLKIKCIWCLNLGENYNISTGFIHSPHHTHDTRHLVASLLSPTYMLMRRLSLLYTGVLPCTHSRSYLYTSLSPSLSLSLLFFSALTKSIYTLYISHIFLILK